MHSQFLIGGFIQSPELKKGLEHHLDGQIYQIHFGEVEEPFFQWIQQNRHRVDCLVLESAPDLGALLETLQIRDILLPVVVIDGTIAPANPTAPPPDPATPTSGQDQAVSQSLAPHYHGEMVYVGAAQLGQIEHFIHQAIHQFLNLPYNHISARDTLSSLEDTRRFLLSLQQQRLSEKLHERLGYLGVFYKRNPDNFIRNLPPPERTQLLGKLRTDYRGIVLNYFVKDELLNQRIDDFVNMAFFADVSVSKIVEVHMELMDSFSKQLKLEGRSEEILLDYRLTLIDVIAHLCEMYRRSIPREV